MCKRVALSLVLNMTNLRRGYDLSNYPEGFTVKVYRNPGSYYFSNPDYPDKGIPITPEEYNKLTNNGKYGRPKKMPSRRTK